MIMRMKIVTRRLSREASRIKKDWMHVGLDLDSRGLKISIHWSRMRLNTSSCFRGELKPLICQEEMIMRRKKVPPFRLSMWRIHLRISCKGEPTRGFECWMLEDLVKHLFSMIEMKPSGATWSGCPAEWIIEGPWVVARKVETEEVPEVSKGGCTYVGTTVGSVAEGCARSVPMCGLVHCCKAGELALISREEAWLGPRPASVSSAVGAGEPAAVVWIAAALGTAEQLVALGTAGVTDLGQCSRSCPNVLQEGQKEGSCSKHTFCSKGTPRASMMEIFQTRGLETSTSKRTSA